jgi:hypothetical protein
MSTDNGSLYVDALVAAADEFIYQRCHVVSSSKHAWWWSVGLEERMAGLMLVLVAEILF